MQAVPTTEQQQIIKYSQNLKLNEILSIQACAGSGKTSTLKEIALANPNKKFLYLAFNKAIANEAKTKFPNNVDPKTLHSLALAYTKVKLGNFKIVNNLTIFDLQKIFNRNIKNNDLIAIYNEFSNFLKSNKALEKAHPVIQDLFGATLAGVLPITHNFYLKFYELAEDKKLESNYDYILLDEAQDTNNVMLSIFLNNSCSKILVGDTFQNIYGFNNTINAFDVIKPNYKTTLSKSFRCKQEILDYANFFLNKLSGRDFKQMISGVDNEEEIKNNAFISRTNGGIIKFINDIDVAEECKYQLMKEPSKLFSPINAIIAYKTKRFECLPDEYRYLKNFETYKEFLEYINTINDKELINAKKILDAMTFEDINKIKTKAQRLYKNTEAFNIITNAHQSKGLEWDSVVLLDDFSDLNSMYYDILRDGDKSEKAKKTFQLEQELHLFYVAITRAKYKLEDRTKNGKLWLENGKGKNKSVEICSDDLFVNQTEPAITPKKFFTPQREKNNKKHIMVK